MTEGFRTPINLNPAPIEEFVDSQTILRRYTESVIAVRDFVHGNPGHLTMHQAARHDALVRARDVHAEGILERMNAGQPDPLDLLLDAYTQATHQLVKYEQSWKGDIPHQVAHQHDALRATRDAARAALRTYLGERP